MAKLGFDDHASCIITHAHQPCLLYNLRVCTVKYQAYAVSLLGASLIPAAQQC